MISLIEEIIERAKEYFQRRMIVTHSKKEAVEIAKMLGSGLQMGWQRLNDWEFVSLANSEEVLGKTYPNLLLDLTESFTANDLGRVISTVAGGGVIVLITPPFEEWKNAFLSYHEKLAIPPFKLSDCRHLFIPRLIKKLEEMPGIYFVENFEIIKDGQEEKIKKPEKRKKKIPKNTVFPKVIYELARTQDQVNVLKIIEELEGILVLTADRGRGKSAVLGLAVAGLRAAKGSKTEVVITSSSRKSVDVLFEFIEIGLRRLGIPYRYHHENQIIGKKIRVTFLSPKEALKRKADLYIVDEAATVPLPVLKKLAELKPIVFSTTIHGYEGSGRTFSVRFMSYLHKFGYVRYHMLEPIRYAEHDPIEAWLFETLLLNAEPEDFELGELKPYSPSPEELFSKEDLLKQFFGLLVLAHYKNTPNDLMTLADAPHHFPFLVLSKGKVVCSIQYALEGGLKGEQIKELFENPKPEGNLIPDAMLKHYLLDAFARHQGARIVRIVTHPKHQGKGVGSFALQELSKSFKGAWIGASFGSSPKLIRFWLKNGFIPVHVSPYRNPISGEYSVIVIKPLRKVKEATKQAHIQFRHRLLASLSDAHWDMETEVAYELLKPVIELNKKLELEEHEMRRFELYLEGRHIYELNFDVISKLVWWYFFNSKRVLSKEEELVLIAKILQRKSWRKVIEELKVERVYETIKGAMEKIWELWLSKA